jgi:hypothetical protein
MAGVGVDYIPDQMAATLRANATVRRRACDGIDLIVAQHPLEQPFEPRLDIIVARAHQRPRLQ